MGTLLGIRLQRPQPFRLLAVLGLLMIAVYLLMPTTHVSRPAQAFALTDAKDVEMLTVTPDTTSILGAFWCQARRECAMNQVSVPRPGAPDGVDDAVKQATQAAADLAGLPMPNELPTVSGVQGNSGGLAFGLAQYLPMTGSTAGTLVAATGSLSADGTVGPVGSLGAKALLAASSGADLLLVPAGSPDLSGQYPGRIAQVSTLEQAVRIVCALPSASCPQLNAATQASAG